MTTGASSSPLAHHLVEGEPEPMTIAQAHPADARGQSLELDALARHVEPVMQRASFGSSSFTFASVR